MRHIDQIGNLHPEGSGQGSILSLALSQCQCLTLVYRGGILVVGGPRVCEEREVKMDRDQATRAFLRDPNIWPRWPYLPLIKPGETMTAVLRFTASGLEISRGANLFALSATTEWEPVSPEVTWTEGWRVD